MDTVKYTAEDGNDNKALILKALRMSSKEYNQLVFDTGLDWIKRSLSLNDDNIVYVISKSGEFWKWWINQWTLRDAVYVYETSLNRQELPLTGGVWVVAGELYRDAHNVNSIKITPNRYVVEDVGKYLKEFTKQETERLKTIVYGNK